MASTQSDSEDKELLFRALVAVGPRKAWLGEAAQQGAIGAALAKNGIQITSEHWCAARSAWRILRERQITMIPAWELPVHFQNCVQPPAALFVRGDVRLLHRRGIAVVGSRRASDSGRKLTARLVGEFGRASGLVVSGGARGIDGTAHEVALHHGVPTVVHLGVACDAVFPAVHRGLFRAVLRCGGALVSEHLPGMPTFAYDHARRNRLIAAHGREVWVVEAARHSGSLQTAEFGRRLGVPVFVPGEWEGLNYQGLEQLVNAGRATVRSPLTATLPRRAV